MRSVCQRQERLSGALIRGAYPGRLSGALIRVVLPQVFGRTVERFVIAVTAVARWLVVTFSEDRRLRVIGQEGRERRQLLQGV